MEHPSSGLTDGQIKIMGCAPDGAVQHRADRKATTQTGLKPKGFFWAAIFELRNFFPSHSAVLIEIDFYIFIKHPKN